MAMRWTKCELCPEMAMMQCESDRARLCWDCDYHVHSDNFLVARHLRYYLCYLCAKPTLWSSDGGRAKRMVRVCHQCTLAEREPVELDSTSWSAPEDGSSDDDDEAVVAAPPPAKRRRTDAIVDRKI